MIALMHVLSDSNIGGAGRYVADITARLDPGQFQIAVVVPPGARIVPLLASSVEVLELPGMTPDASFSRDSVHALSALMKKRRPDVVHTHGSLAGRIAGRRCGARVVYTRHTTGEPLKPGSPKWHFGRMLNRALADRVIAVSGHIARVLEQEGIPRAMITVIHNGVDLSRFNAGDYDTMQLKAQYGWEERIVCAVVARLEPIKGHRHLLEAWAMMQEGLDRQDGHSAGSHPSRDWPRAQLMLVGDGSLRGELEQQVQDSGCQDSVAFAGELSEVRPSLALADIVLLPSLNEGLPIALVEAMAMGKPCIASRAGGIPEVITDEYDGLLVPPADAPALCAALKRLLARSELRRQFGLAARQTVEERFDITGLAGECGRLYQALCRKS